MPVWMTPAPRDVRAPLRTALSMRASHQRVEWRTDGVPAARWDEFRGFAHKALGLVHIGRCGACGSTKGGHQPVWGLGMRVCRACWVDNVVSHRTLSDDYGIEMLKPVPPRFFVAAGAPQGLPFYLLVQRRVFFLRQHTGPGERERYTQHPGDFPESPRILMLYLFWRPHLAALVDLPAMRAARTECRRATLALSSVLKRRFAASAARKPKRWNPEKWLDTLRRNEVRRPRGEREISYAIESYANYDKQTSMLLHAERMPEPWRVHV